MGFEKTETVPHFSTDDGSFVSKLVAKINYTGLLYITMLWDGIAQSVKRLATGWKVRGSNPDKGEILRTRPDRPCSPSTLLYDGQHVSFPGVKWPGYNVDHPPPPTAEVKERVELYLYLPFVPSWQVMR
jgi:hypothetical protein